MTPPAAPLDTQLIETARDLLADLRHLVRWYDQLGPEDIARAEVTIARASTLPLQAACLASREVEQLRTALIECCNAVGGMAGPTVSTAFLLMVPAEVRAVVAGLRSALPPSGPIGGESPSGGSWTGESAHG